MKIRNNFIDTVLVLNKFNIDYWVDFGTLLGIHRDHDIILGDNDADICVPISEEANLRNALQNSNLRWEYVNEGELYRVYSKLIIGADIFVDLYLIKYEEDLVNIPYVPLTPIEYLKEIEESEVQIDLKKIKIKQPVRWRDLLEWRYGKRWTEKVKKWWLGYLTFEDVKNPLN